MNTDEYTMSRPDQVFEGEQDQQIRPDSLYLELYKAF